MKNLISCLLCMMAANIYCQPPRLVLPMGHTKPIGLAVFSSDNKILLTASGDETAKLWQVATVKC
jgi:WD40 repeat protein